MTDENSRYHSILTDVGIAKQAAAHAEGIPWKLAKMGVGDANEGEPTPDPTQTELINEHYRAPLNSLIKDPINPGTWIAELVIPLDVGGWWVRELGLYDEDDELVAVANCPPSYKPLPSQGSVRTQRIRMRFVISNSGQVELIVSDDIVFATMDYVDEKTQDLAPIDSPSFQGAPKAPTPPRFDNTEALATTEFVQAALGSFSGVRTERSSGTTLPVTDIGKMVVLDDGSIQTVALPLSQDVAEGSTITIHNPTGVEKHITVNGTDGISPDGNLYTAIKLGPADTFSVTSQRGVWRVHGVGALTYSGMFTGVRGSAGRQRLPNGMLMQWINVQMPTTQGQSVHFNWPITFDNEVSAVALASNLTAAQYGYLTLSVIDRTTQGATLVNTGISVAPSSLAPTTIIAIGY